MWLFDFFKKDKKIDIQTADKLFEDDVVGKHCVDCVFNKDCKEKDEQHSYYCDWVSDIGKDFDKTKDSILIIDDHEGMVSFLNDDIRYLDEEGIIDLNELNVVSISGNHAAFNLEANQIKANGLNIKYAIIDITLGGSQITTKGNIKYTGVDVYKMITDFEDDFEFLFYTGNNLNPHIRSNERLINQFKDLKGENIKDYVLFKTSMDIDTRRKFIADKLFGKRD